MRKLKLTSTLAKGLIERFEGLTVGQPCVFPTLLPALSSNSVQAFLLNAKAGQYWEFRLFWHGVEIGMGTAIVAGEYLELETL